MFGPIMDSDRKRFVIIIINENNMCSKLLSFNYDSTNV